VPLRWLLRPELFASEYELPRFSDVAGPAGLDVDGLAGGAIMEDFDGDDLLDIMVSSMSLRGQLRRFRNNGDGTFADVTEAAGLLSFHPTQTAVWLDYNGDGWLDLFVGNESLEGDVHPCELYRNNADGTFAECAKEAGLAYIGFVKAVVSGDYNNDGRPDLYHLDS